MLVKMLVIMDELRDYLTLRIAELEAELSKLAQNEGSNAITIVMVMPQLDELQRVWDMYFKV